MLLVPVLCHAKGPETFPGYRLEKPPVIDGKIESDEWSGVPEATGGFAETTGAKSAIDQRFWAAYDSKYIYFAGRVYGMDPKKVRCNEYRQGVALFSDDFVAIGIDPFGTLANFNQFEVNARGATNLRIAGGRASKAEWLGEVLAKGRVTPQFWEVEARIPWSVMRLPGPGKRDLRMSFYRFSPQEQTAYIWNDISGNKPENIALWKDVEIPPTVERHALKVLPYGLVGAQNGGEPLFNAGADVRYSPTDRLDIVGSVNPDFRNVEGDILSLDFSYFERLAKESRPFFQEGAGFFRTSQDAPLFASQRIDRFDTGVKVFGSVGDRLQVGLLDAMTIGDRNQSAGVLRYTFNEKTGVRLGMTNWAERGLDNTATFADLQQSVGPWSLYASHMSTRDAQEGNGYRVNTGGVFMDGGVVAGAEYVEVSPEFLPRLGFAPERDFRGVSGFIEQRRTTQRGPFRETGYSANAYDFHHFDRSAYRTGGSVGGNVTLKNDLSLYANARAERFEGSDDHLVTVGFVWPPNSPQRSFGAEMAWGEFGGHEYRSLAPQFRIRPWRNLQLSLRYQSVRYQGSQDQAILSANYELNAYDAVSARVVHRDSDTNAYVSFRRAGNKGVEYYLIVGDPNARTFQTSIILKALFPFEIR